MPTKPKYVPRATLEKYAAALGRGSLAACALSYYDDLKAAGSRAKIEMTNNGFRIHTKDGVASYD